jgi:hypothetical protein
VIISNYANMCRVGQNRIPAPYMAVCMVIFLLKIPYKHRIYVCMYGRGQPYKYVPCALRRVHIWNGSHGSHGCGQPYKYVPCAFRRVHTMEWITGVKLTTLEPQVCLGVGVGEGWGPGLRR